MVLLVACSSNKQADSGLSEKLPGTQETAKVQSEMIAGLEGEEAMRQAALEGNTDLVFTMIRDGARVNAMNPEGQTALMLAAYNGHTEIVRKLLGSDAAIEQRDLAGRTALLYASTGPFAETVQLLLDNGAEPNIIDSEEHFSPLMYAASEGNLEVVKVLMEAGADHTLKDVDGDDAKTFALQAGHSEVAAFLEKAGK